MRQKKALAFLVLFLALSSCGKKGKLSLPKEESFMSAKGLASQTNY